MADEANDPAKNGADTSEHTMAASVNLWGTILAVLGVVTSIGASVIPALGDNSKIGIIAGAIVACAGAIAKALASLGYSASRSAVKVAQIENQNKAA